MEVLWVKTRLELPILTLHEMSPSDNHHVFERDLKYKITKLC